MRKMILINQKGGCGKTTTAINLAGCLAAAGRKVLLIDLDPQGHAGLGLGFEPHRVEPSIYEVLAGRAGIEEAILPARTNLDAVLSNLVLAALEQELAGVPGREIRLHRSLADLPDRYDYLIIDSPPNVGLLTINGLMAATEAVIPVDPCSFSLNGLGQLLETVRLLEHHTGHLVAPRTLAANVDRRTSFGRTLGETLRGHSPAGLATVIHTSTRLREAAARGRTIIEFDPHCAAALDFTLLAREILEGEQKAGKRHKPREVLFTFTAPADATVEIAGDFTKWEPVALRYDRRGGRRWQKRIRLKPGAYQYKYLLNGQWLLDPTNRNVVDNGLGSSNSWLSV